MSYSNRTNLNEIGSNVYKELSLYHGTLDLEGVIPFFEKLAEGLESSFYVFSSEELKKMEPEYHEKIFRSWKVRGFPVDKHRGLRGITHDFNDMIAYNSLVLFGPDKENGFGYIKISHVSQPLLLKDPEDRVALRNLEFRLKNFEKPKKSNISTYIGIYHIGQLDKRQEDGQIYSFDLDEHGGEQVVLTVTKDIMVPIKNIDYSKEINHLLLLRLAVDGFHKYYFQRKNKIYEKASKFFNEIFNPVESKVTKPK